MNTALMRRLAPLGLLVAVALACNLAQNVKRGIDKASGPTTLTSADGKFQLTVPGGWRDDPELHEEATLRASNRMQEMYAVVISENKEDFDAGMTLQEFAALSRTATMGNVQGAEAGPPAPAQVGGYPALEYEMRGVVESINVTYLNTLVETPAHFHQIVTWTLRTRFDQNRATLREVAQSFREADAGAPPGGAEADRR